MRGNCQIMKSLKFISFACVVGEWLRLCACDSEPKEWKTEGMKEYKTGRKKAMHRVAVFTPARRFFPCSMCVCVVNGLVEWSTSSIVFDSLVEIAKLFVFYSIILVTSKGTQPCLGSLEKLLIEKAFFFLEKAIKFGWDTFNLINHCHLALCYWYFLFGNLVFYIVLL